MEPNPYASPSPPEGIIVAELVDSQPVERDRYVLNTIAGVACTVGAVFSLDEIVKGDVPRLAMLVAAGGGIAYSARLSDPR